MVSGRRQRVTPVWVWAVVAVFYDLFNQPAQFAARDGGAGSGKKGVPMWLKLILGALILAIILGELLMHFGDRKTDSIVPVKENPIDNAIFNDSVKNDNSIGKKSQPGNLPGNDSEKKVDESKTPPSQGIVPPQKGHNGQETDHPEKPQPKVFEKNVCAIVSENISKNIVDYVIAGLNNANLGLTFPEDGNGNPQWRIELKETVQEMERETEGKIDYKAYVTLSASIIKDNEKFGYCEVKESARSYESTMKALDSARENAKDLIIEKIIGRIKQ